MACLCKLQGLYVQNPPNGPIEPLRGGIAALPEQCLSQRYVRTVCKTSDDDVQSVRVWSVMVLNDLGEVARNNCCTYRRGSAVWLKGLLASCLGYLERGWCCCAAWQVGPSWSYFLTCFYSPGLLPLGASLTLRPCCSLWNPAPAEGRAHLWAKSIATPPIALLNRRPAL